MYFLFARFANNQLPTKFKYYTTALLLLLLSQAALAQPDATSPTEKKEHLKSEYFTLRYKPQVGTTLYDIETVVTHHLENGKVFPVYSRTQIAYENIAVDLRKNRWTFDRYFTKFTTFDRDSTIKEIGSINKTTRMTYSMIGEEIAKRVVDTVQLSEDAQFLFYFFKAPKILLPLPEQRVLYGATWEDSRQDTVRVPGGTFYYDVKYHYKFDGVLDTLGGTAAVITSRQEGIFYGEQQRPGEQALHFDGPISGVDTTYLDLLTGRVASRITGVRIPVNVTASHGKPSTDALEVRSTIFLNKSNMKVTHVHED
jgi:hypothetical protein